MRQCYGDYSAHLGPVRIGMVGPWGVGCGLAVESRVIIRLRGTPCSTLVWHLLAERVEGRHSIINLYEQTLRSLPVLLHLSIPMVYCTVYFHTFDCLVPTSTTHARIRRSKSLIRSFKAHTCLVLFTADVVDEEADNSNQPSGTRLQQLRIILAGSLLHHYPPLLF